MLEIVDISKRYKEQLVLDHLSLSVDQGEVVVIMGPSGCGKSTLLRCINGLIKPDEGDIRLFGRSIRQLSGDRLIHLRRQIGFVFQHFNLIERLKVWENVALGLAMAGVPRPECRKKALKALELVGLEQLAERRADALSGGQKQRVGIARAIVNQPQLLLWDEPTASLDPIRVQEVLEVMESLLKVSSASMVIVTHEIPFAFKVADRLVLMDSGKVVEEGYPKKVLTRPDSRIGRDYARLTGYRYGIGLKEAL
jgi:polar amino acid transport system ATP-binding protein